MKTRADFRRVARFGRKWARPGLVLQAAKNPQANENTPPRVGFTASRKVGNAVERNRAKRRLRAAARDVIRLKGQPGIDYVLIGRHTTLTRRYADLVDDLNQALERTRPEAGAEPAKAPQDE